MSESEPGLLETAAVIPKPEAESDKKALVPTYGLIKVILCFDLNFKHFKHSDSKILVDVTKPLKFNEIADISV